MRTGLVVVFLVSHGLVHLAIWLPHPDPTADRPLPFVPDHSILLSATAAPAVEVHRIAVGGAVAAAAGFVLAAVAIAVGVPGAATVTVVAAVLGLALKALFFHPWLSFGIAIDLGVLAGALAGWPLSL
jgi:hypothetical protein